MEIKSEPDDYYEFAKSSEVLNVHKEKVCVKTEGFEMMFKEGEESKFSNSEFIFIKQEKRELNDEDLPTPHEASSSKASFDCGATIKRKSFTCSLCAYSTDRKSRLFAHVKTHAAKYYFECAECGCRTKYITYTSREKLFKCSVCRRKCKAIKKAYTTKDKEKIINCNSCGFRAYGKHLFQTQHNLICNTVEKPYVCTSCDYRCATQSMLTDHLVSHIGRNPFPCSICNYRTNSTKNLEAHIKTHKPLACARCDYRCATLPTLNLHVKTHHLKKKEKFKYEANGQLESRMLERPFQINNCDLEQLQTIKMDEVSLNSDF